MKIMRWLVIVAILIPLPSFADTYWGGELPSIRDTRLQAEVTLSGGIYTYSYTITSGPTNTGQIWSFDLDIKQPREGVDLSSDGLTNGPGYARHTSALVLSEPSTPKMVPVGSATPLHWNFSLGILGQAGWGANDDPYMILPGQSLGGFQVTSWGLPGIRDFRIEPDLVPPPEESDITPEQIQAVEDKVAFKGKTLGPTALSRFLSPRDFVDTIRDYVNQCVALAWLTDPALASTLLSQLDAARAAIDANYPSRAKPFLQQFMTSIEQAGPQQRTSEALGLLYFNAKYLNETLPDTFIWPLPKLDLQPPGSTRPIGTVHTATASVTRRGYPMPDIPVTLTVTAGPNAGLMWEGVTGSDGKAPFAYSSATEGTDQLEARTPELPDISGPMTSPPAQVTWSGGPDLTIDLFIPPIIKTSGGRPIIITEMTANHGTTPAGPSITRYFLSPDSLIEPDKDRGIRDRAIPALEPEASSQAEDQTFVLPPDLPEGTYYAGACADADKAVVELDERNNCQVSRLQISLPMEVPPNRSPDCTQARPSLDRLWPPNHRLVPITILGVTDPDNDPVAIRVTRITQDEPTDGLGDGDTSPDGFGMGTAQAQVRAERSGTGNGRVYAIAFAAEDGKGGSCSGTVHVGVPHDRGKGAIPIDDGQMYDSTLA